MQAFFSWIKNYNQQKLKGDMVAGITTGIMLIPQGMAYALIAGLPPIHGLYAALVPPVIYAMFGTSYQLSVGPVATTSLLVFAGLSELQLQGTDFILATAVLALLVGVIQLLFGIGRLGFIVNFLSRPVISGYTSAAALIIGFSQIRNLAGIDGKSDTLIFFELRNTLAGLDNADIATFIFGITGVASLILIRRITPRIPASLAVVALSISVVYFFHLENDVKVLGAIPSGLPAFQFPGLSLENMRALLPLALIISLVSFLESISISKILQTRNKDYQVSANSELLALGLANIAGSVFRAFPVSGAFARSLVNEQAGAKTPFAIIISSGLIAATLLLLTPVFYYLPKSTLAAIIMVAVVNLIDVREAKTLWKISKRDFSMMIFTALATLSFGIREGIVTGIVLSLGLVIYKSTYPHTAQLGKLPSTSHYRNLARFPAAMDRKDAIIFRFDAQLYFANIQYFIDTLCRYVSEKEKTLKVIVINAQAINTLDTSAAYGLKELISELKKRGYDLYFTEVIGPVRDIMKKTGLYDLIGKDHFHLSIQDALDHFDSRLKADDAYALQSND